jgi:hypothetical protein
VELVKVKELIVLFCDTVKDWLSTCSLLNSCGAGLVETSSRECSKRETRELSTVRRRGSFRLVPEVWALLGAFPSDARRCNSVPWSWRKHWERLLSAAPDSGPYSTPVTTSVSGSATQRGGDVLFAVGARGHFAGCPSDRWSFDALHGS